MIPISNFFRGSISSVGQERSVKKHTPKHHLQARVKALIDCPVALTELVGHSTLCALKFIAGIPASVIIVCFNKTLAERSERWFIKNGKQALYRIPIAILSPAAVIAPELTTKVTAKCYRKTIKFQDYDAIFVKKRIKGTKQHYSVLYSFDKKECKWVKIKY